jgi:serine/threonine-protein kinase
MSVDGGGSITVSDTLTGVAGASWGPDNFIYVDGSGPTGLLRVEAKPGVKPQWFTVLDSASGEYNHSWPEALPNGRGVLFTVAFNGRNGIKGRNSYAIAVADIPSGQHRILIDDALYPRYSMSGHLLYVTANKTLMVVPFDQNSMKVTGEPTELAEGMRLGDVGSADLAVSATGTLVYTTGPGRGNHELVWVTRDGKKTQAVDPGWQGGFLYFPALSSDGKLVAIARSASPGEPINIWIKRLDRGEARKLTLEGNTNVNPVWTPDGRSITFSSEVAAGAFDLFTKRADGGAQRVLLAHEKRSLFSPRWSPDGKWMVFQTDPAQSGAGDILGMRPGLDSTPVPLVVTKFTEAAPVFSPDGHWLAYISNESGRYEIYVVPFPNTSAGKWAISADGGTEPVWAHSGSELFYRDRSQNFVAVAVKTRPTFAVGRVTVLFPGAGFDSYTFNATYAVSADDGRFMMSRPAQTGIPDTLIVVDNWFEELKGLVPGARRGGGRSR